MEDKGSRCRKRTAQILEAKFLIVTVINNNLGAKLSIRTSVSLNIVKIPLETEPGLVLPDCASR